MNTCPNPKDPKFKELVNATNEKIAYNLWSLNNGYPLDYTKDGKESELFKYILKFYNGDRRKAIIKKAKMYIGKYNLSSEEPTEQFLKDEGILKNTLTSVRQQAININSISNNTVAFGVELNKGGSKTIQTEAITWQRINPNGIVAYRKYKDTPQTYTPETVAEGWIGNPYSTGEKGADTVQKFYDWLTTGNNFGNSRATEEFRQAIIQKILVTPENTPILYYTELGRPSHATVLGYLITNKQLINSIPDNVEKVNTLEESISKPSQQIVVTGKKYKKYNQYIKLSSDTKFDLDDNVKEKIKELAKENIIFLLDPNDKKYDNFLSYLISIGANYKKIKSVQKQESKTNTVEKLSLQDIIEHLEKYPISKEELNRINKKLFETNSEFKLTENLHYVIKDNKVYLNKGLLQDIKHYDSIDAFNDEIDVAFETFKSKLETFDIKTKNFFNKKENKEQIRSYLLLSLLINNNALQLNMKSIYLHKDKEDAAIKGFTKRAGSNITLSEKPTVGKPNTLPKTIKIAMFDSQTQQVANALGQIEEINIWDGACFENGISNLLSKNSYNKRYEGTKKPIGMFVDGFNHITMKCSTVALTNWRIRACSFNGQVNLHKLHEKMLSLPISDINQLDLIKPFIGSENSVLNNSLKYVCDANNEPIYVRNGDDFYKIGWIKKKENNIYTISYQKENKTVYKKDIEINTVADLWNAFGAEYSYKLVNGEYIPSEGSLEATYKYVVNCGFKDDNGDLIQPLKESMIYIAGDKTAFKNGVTNLNSKESLEDDSNLMYIPVTTQDMGVILDYNHSTENSEIASLSQALLLIAQNKDALEQVSEVWEAIGTLMKSNLDQLKLETNTTDVKDYLISKLKEDISKNDFGSEQYIAELCDGLKEELSFADNNIYGLILKTAFQVINDSALRLKYQGIPGILNPSAKIMQTYRIGDKIYTPQAIVKQGLKLIKNKIQLDNENTFEIGELSNENLLTLVVLNSTLSKGKSLLEYIKELSNDGTLKERLDYIQNNWDSDLKQADTILDVNTKRETSLKENNLILPLGNSVKIEDNGTVTFYDTVIDPEGKEIYLDTIEKLSEVLRSDKEYRKVLNKPSDLKPMNITWKINGKTKSIWGSNIVSFLQRLTIGIPNETDKKLRDFLITHYDIKQSDTKQQNDFIKKRLLNDYFKNIRNGKELRFKYEDYNITDIEYIDIDNNSYKQTNAEVILPKGFLSKCGIKNKNLNEITRKDFSNNEEGQKQWMSFLKIKTLLSVRIPSDGLHSMMAMDVVGVTDDDSNNVGVCIWQLWLQGSDLDIDKAYMLLYQLDNDGIISPWSGLFDYSSEETFNASLELPLPANKYCNVDVVIKTIDTKFTDLIAAWYKSDGSDKIRISGQILRYLSSHDNAEIVLTEDIKNNFEDNLDNNSIINEIAIDISELVKQHVNITQNQNSISNFITHNLISITSDPACIFHSQSTIDIGLYKDKLKTNKTDIKHNDKISYLTFIYNNLTGKDGVGIVANSTKAFTAISHYTDKYGTNSLLKNLKLKLQKDLEKISSTDKYIEGDQKEQGQTALLNVATDNAKELVLEAIHGDKNFLKVIALLNTLGFTAEEQIKFILSEPFIKVYEKTKNVNRLLDSNFNNYFDIQPIIKSCILEDNSNKEVYETIQLLYKASEEYSQTARMLKNGGLKAVNDSKLAGIISIFTSPYNSIVVKQITNWIKEANKLRISTENYLNATAKDSEGKIIDEKKAAFLKLVEKSGKKFDEYIELAIQELDIYQYFTDPEYKNFVIDICGKFSTFINPYILLEDQPIYYNMWQYFSDFLNAATNITNKFNFATKTASQLALKLKYLDTEYIIKDSMNNKIQFYLKSETLTRKARNWYDQKMIYEFIKNNEEIKNLIFKSENPAKDISENPAKDISDFINNVLEDIIPDLRFKYPDNEFLKNIEVISNLYTNLKTIQFRKRNLNKDSDNLYIWQDIIRDFKSISDETIEINGKVCRIDNLLFLVNLITNYNQPGGKRITNIFGNTFYSQNKGNLSNSSIGAAWIEFVNDYETNFNLSLSDKDEFNLIAFLLTSTKASVVERVLNDGNTQQYELKNNNEEKIDIYLYPSITHKILNNTLKEAVDENLIQDVEPIEEIVISPDIEEINEPDRTSDNDNSQQLSFEFYIEQDNNIVSNYVLPKSEFNSHSERRSKLKEIEPFLKQFGIEIKYQEVPGQPNATGALVGNVMYINPKIASDSLEAPMHEWLHFIFGILKAVDPQFYFDVILENFKDTEYATNALHQFNNITAYKDLTSSDILEEALIRTITDLYSGKIAYNQDKNQGMIKTLKAVKQSLIALGIMSKNQTLEKFLTGTFNKEAKVFKKIQNKHIIQDYCNNSILGQKVANLLRIKLQKGELKETEC